MIEWFEGAIAGSGREQELLDVVEDTSESHDLSGSHPRVAERLRAELEGSLAISRRSADANPKSEAVTVSTPRKVESDSPKRLYVHFLQAMELR